MINSEIHPDATVTASESWVEACCVRSPLVLRGSNVIVGVDISEPLDLPAEACLDVSKGLSRDDKPVWFVRCHGVHDTFKQAVGAGASFCGMPLDRWLQAVGVRDSECWEDEVPTDGRTLWNARVFPAEKEPGGYRRWLWMFDAARATPEQKQSFLAADRYSSAEIALLVDQEHFYAERQAIHLRLRPSR
jgi:hypothetical protein